MTVLTPSPLPIEYDDPCDDVKLIAGTLAHWHTRRAVQCAVCRVPVHYAWWVGDHHVCGRCRFGPGDQ